MIEFKTEAESALFIREGRLVRVLEDWLRTKGNQEVVGITGEPNDGPVSRCLAESTNLGLVSVRGDVLVPVNSSWTLTMDLAVEAFVRQLEEEFGSVRVTAYDALEILWDCE